MGEGAEHPDSGVHPLLSQRRETPHLRKRGEVQEPLTQASSTLERTRDLVACSQVPGLVGGAGGERRDKSHNTEPRKRSQERQRSGY